MIRPTLLPLIAAAALVAAIPAHAAEMREFTDAAGRTLKASVVKVDAAGETATIKRADGKVFTLPFNKLSAADQEYLRGWRPAAAAAGSAVPVTTDWPTWRGPNRDGISPETGLRHEWPEDNPPKELWRTKGLGKGMSSLSISGGKFFTIGEKGGKTYLICRKAEGGEDVWETEFSGGGDPNGTPTVDPASGLVFAISRGGDIACCEVESGKLVWKKSFSGDFGGKMMSSWGFSESPLVDGDRVICTPGAQDALLAALDKKTGKVIWKTDASGADLGSAGQDGAGYGSAVISQGGGIKQYVQLVGRGLVGVAADDGRLLWNYNRIANGTANIPTPIIKGDYVFGSTGYGDGGSALLELRKSGSNGVSAKEVYYLDNKELQNHHGGMVLVGDYIYMGHGHNNGFPECVELKTGKTHWDRPRGAGSGSAAVVYADGYLFFRYQNHIMALIEATPDGYHLKGSFKIGSSNGESWPHPVIHDGKLFLRDQDELLCYDLK